MLVRLFGKNFRSFRDDFELSMVAADFKRSADRGRGIVDVSLKGSAEPLHLLRVAAIYGHNGAGKSTVLTAASALRWLIATSSKASEPGSSIPTYEPFLLDPATAQSPVSLGCDVVHKDQLLRYEISYREKRIDSGRLTLLDAGAGETVLIDREHDLPVEGELIKSSESNQLYVKEMQPNVAVVAKLAQHGPAKGNESVRPFYASLAKCMRYADFCTHASGAMPVGIDATREQFAEDEDYRRWIMSHLIKESDIGIQDVKTSREDTTYPDFLRQFASDNPEIKLPDKEVIISFVHHGRQSRAIEFGLESAGTKKLFGIADYWWRLAHKDICLFADELSASLHPRLLDALIRGVNDAEPGQVRSQLVFATHDTGLLEGRDGLPPALRRDQVYFASKRDDGASELYGLSEFKEEARPVHNLRKRYLSGLYGAVPSIEELPL